MEFFNTVIPTKSFPARNPRGFYRLIPILKIIFLKKVPLSDHLDSGIESAVWYGQLRVCGHGTGPRKM